MKTSARLLFLIGLLAGPAAWAQTPAMEVKDASDDTLLLLDTTAGLLVRGTEDVGTIPAAGGGVRLMWYPKKYAFRAGWVNDQEWDDANIGKGSVAMGINTMAGGPGSIALGSSTVATGAGAVALGERTTASSLLSISMGYNTVSGAFASTAMGSGTNAAGDLATAMGGATQAVGFASTAMGVNTVAQSYSSLAIGRFNVAAGTAGSWVDTDPLFVAGNGTADDSRSNALTLYKNGNLETAGEIHARGGGVRFPDGTLQTTAATGGGATDHGSLTGLSDDDHAQYLLANGTRASTDGFAVTGERGTGTIPATGAGVRLLWYPGKAAFRAGEVEEEDTGWDDDRIGRYSAAIGRDVVASGQGSTAFGDGSEATGAFSLAAGASSSAAGEGSVATGISTNADGYGAVAMGYITGADGESAFAMGSAAFAVGPYSAAIGNDVRSIGHSSTAMGNGTRASGDNATALGRSTTAQAFSELTIGRFNVVEGTTNLWIDTEPLFVAGNGSSDVNRSNALTLYKNGNLETAGEIHARGGGVRFPDGTLQTTAATGSGATDHGSLTGLSDDDHAQYLLANGTRTATGGFAVAGTFNTGTIPATGAGVRLMWYPGKAAFRAGRASTTSWNDDNVGLYSFAAGDQTQASGDYATAIGFRATAHAFASLAIGQYNVLAGTPDTWFGVDPLFVAGNGSSDANRSNALTLYKNGRLLLGGGFQARGGAPGANGASNNGYAFSGTGDNDSGLFSTADGTVALYTNNTERLRLTGQGVFLPNLPSGDYHNVQWDPSTGQLYQENSSRRYKENIRPLEDDFAALLRAEPKTYTRPGAPGRPEIGLIAEEVDALGLTHLVDYDAEGRPDGVRYDKLALYLIEILKAQQRQIDAVTVENEALRQARRQETDRLQADLDVLRNRVDRLDSTISTREAVPD